MQRIHLFVLVVALCAAPWLQADESLAPAVLKDLKGATAFIKVDAGTLRMSGSGFLIRLSGGTGYVVTNNHVIDASGPHVVASSPHRTRVITTTSVAKISVVFSSGTPDELSLPAEVVAADKDRDLAILLVKGITRAIKPIDLDVPADLVETTPVFVFGFPFGERMSVEGHNPAITVGRGAISSIRLNQKGETVAVQIDGALNPGNSGGPVVDAKGRLAGIAVATIVGSGIGLAIPPSELKKELAGRIGIAHVVAARASEKTNIFTAHVTVPVIDPMGQVRSVTFYWVLGSAAGELKAESHLGDFPATHKLLLKVDGAEASGSFDVPAVATGHTDIIYEASYLSGTSVSYSVRSAPMSLGDDAATPTLAVAGARVPPNQPGAGGGRSLPAPAGGDEYIAAALATLASEDGNTQRSAAEQLWIAPLIPSRRSAVLAALAPHLGSDDLALRVRCIRAYAHWATTAETHVLAEVAQAQQEHAERGEAPTGWASAIVGLVRIDPAEAERIYAQRKDEFFFWAISSQALLKLAEEDPPHADTALGLLRKFDVMHPIIRVSLSDAIHMLESDSAAVRAQGCDALMIAPTDSQRERVLSLLSPHIYAADGKARLKYVQAYARWADVSHLKELRAIVDFPTDGPMTDHDLSWGAAIGAMVRVGGAQLAIDAYNTRGDSFWLQAHVVKSLNELAETAAPEQAAAWSLLQQFKHDQTRRLQPLPPGEAPLPPATLPSPPTTLPALPTTLPAAPTAKAPDVAAKPAEAVAPGLPIPDEALHGQIRGKAFLPDRVEMQNEQFALRSGKGVFADQEIRIMLQIGDGGRISGRKYHVEMDDSAKPVIFVSRMKPGDRVPQTFVARRYRMDLEFGTLADDKLPGKIRLVVDDEQGVDLTGSFVADYK